MNFLEPGNKLLDKGNSQIDTETDAFNAGVECLQLIFDHHASMLPQIAASIRFR